MLFDDYKNRFPLWLHPIQIRLIPVSNKYVSFCQELINEKKSLPIRIDIDARNEPIGKRIKAAREELIPYNFVIGGKELKGEGNIRKLASAIKRIIEQLGRKPSRSVF
jgi:threonyl-tRNA synthetase